MRAYISAEDGFTPETRGTVAMTFVCLDDEGNIVEHVDMTSDAHKMMARLASLADETFTRIINDKALADVSKLVVEAQRLGIVKPDEAEAFREHGDVPRVVGHA